MTGRRSVARRPAASRARRAATIVAVGALSFLAAEATVRIAARTLPGVRVLAEPRGERSAEPRTFAEFQHAFRDHLVPFRERYGFRNNSLGFHDEEFATDFPGDGFRVVALGDSFAYGHVPYGHAHLTLADALLQHARATAAGDGAPPPPFELANLGVPASGIADYALVWQLVGRNLAPDLVLIHVYAGNDPRDFLDPTRFGAVRAASRSWLLTFVRRATRLALERARHDVAPEPISRPQAAPAPGAAVGAPNEQAQGARRTSQRYTDDSPELATPSFSDEAFAGILRDELRTLTRPGADADLPDWDAFRAALAALVERIRADGASVVLVLAPSRLQVHPEELERAVAASGLPRDAIDPDLPRTEVAAVAERVGVPLIDLTPELRRAAGEGGGRLYRPNDTHWGLRGNAIAAAELAMQLLDRGLVPRGPQTPAQ